jgi:uncharacterized protein YndB with AHSA1/START domain
MLPNNQTAAATKIVIDRDKHAIVLTRMFAVPRQQIFEAWTRPEHVTRWWDPKRQPLTECAIDLRPGGAFRFITQPPNSHQFAGVYREIAPPDCLVFEAMGAIGRVIFQGTGSETHLTVRIECSSAAQLEQYLKMGIDAGTAQTLDNLVAYVGATVC